MAEPGDARIPDGLPLDDVIRPQREVGPAPTVERIEDGLPEHQKDRTGKQSATPRALLLSQQQTHQSVWSQQLPASLEEAIGSGRDGMPAHGIEVELIPGAQLVLRHGG